MLKFVPLLLIAAASPAIAQAPAPQTQQSQASEPAKKNPLDADSVRDYIEKQVGKLDDQVPAILNSVWSLIGRGIFLTILIPI